MGAHAFDGDPEHCAIYRAMRDAPLPRLYGLAERWNMPAVRHRAVLGDGARFGGVDHYVLTYHVGGAHARRLDGERRPVARAGALSLQAPGSGGVFASRGAVEYGHFYFRQSLLCEIGDALGIGDGAEIDDFFALFDPDGARDAATYLSRAADRGDPPTAIEMDSRAYLIGLGLLRTMRARAGYAEAAARRPVRADLTRALALVEERLAEPLRLGDLAAAAGLSPFHFARVFRAQTGETPAQHLMRRRVDRAVALIRETRRPLAEIAAATGFSSQAHMARRVRAATGATPGGVRRDGGVGGSGSG
jgi:AraC family transcriptional regulator